MADSTDPDFKFKEAASSPPRPPRLTGQSNVDLASLRDWLEQFYISTVVQSGLLDPIYQQVQGEISFAKLPDPKATTVARAQATANAAWTAGEQFKFDVENLLKKYSFGGTFTISNTDTTASPIFPVGDIGTTNYRAVASAVGASGAPANDAFRVIAATKGTGSIGFTIAGAPGAGNSVTYDYHVITDAFPDLGGIDTSEEA